jgi:hypothetical protein
MPNLPTDPRDRKERPITRGVLDYFPDAIAAVSNVSFVGNEQHNPGEEMHWARDKSSDHADCIARHLIERGTADNDGLLHTAKLAWRALALLQTELEERAEQKPDSPSHPDGTPPIRSRHRSERAAPRDSAEFVNLSAQMSNNIMAARTDVSQRTVYIAGPMRGYELYNFPAFIEADERCRLRGWTTLNPAKIEMDNGLDPFADPEGVTHRVQRFTDQDWLQVILRDLACILILNPDTDALVVLPGWETSTGATAEVFLARWLGLPILDARDFTPLVAVDGGGLTHVLREYLERKAAAI